MSRRARDLRMWAAPVVLLVAAVLVAVLPRLDLGSSSATLTATATASSNVATANTCSTGSKSWNSSSNGGLLDTNVLASGTRKSWNRFSGSSSISNDSWMSSSSWTATTSSNAPTYNQSGALYCDSNAALSLTTTSSYVGTASVAQSTFGMASTSTNLVLMLWFKTTTSSAGVLASASDGSSVDRVLWVDSSGYLRFSGRSGGTSTSWSTTATGAVVDDGQWHFAVAVMTPYNASSGGVSLYLDGEALTSVANKSTPFRSFSNSIRWTVGDTLSTSSTPSGAPTAGAVGTYDEFVLVASNGLTAAQIQTLYLSADQ